MYPEYHQVKSVKVTSAIVLPATLGNRCRTKQRIWGLAGIGYLATIWQKTSHSVSESGPSTERARFRCAKLLHLFSWSWINTWDATTGITIDFANTGVTTNDATADINILSQGSNQHHNNLQPSIVLNYIIKC